MKSLSGVVTYDSIAFSCHLYPTMKGTRLGKGFILLHLQILFCVSAFGLKKLFFPLLIGAQIFKSVLLAMFLPSILGSFGKILGKGKFNFVAL